ncbi:MAG: hypothetical protein E7647_04465 [Ruminococcaceae bacterium]|nr:hypothetical protein [Oscillospiraceae bacterium]
MNNKLLNTIKEKVNFPLLLLGIYILLHLMPILGSVIRFIRALTSIKTLLTIPFSALSLAAGLAPVIIFIMLILHETGKLKAADKIIGITCLVAAAVRIWSIYLNGKQIFHMLIHGNDWLPVLFCLFNLIIDIFFIIMLIKVYIALKGENPGYPTSKIFFFVAAGLIAVFGSISVVQSFSSMLNIYGSFLYFIALYYLPLLFGKSTEGTVFDREKKEAIKVTFNKVKIICGVFVLMLVLYAVAMIASDTTSYYDKYDDVFQKDPNTWTEDEKQYVNDFFEWLDD